MLPLAQSSAWGWGDPKVAVLLAASVVLLVVFGWSQLRIRDPLVDLRRCGRKPIVVTNLASVLFGFALFASFIGTASYVEAPEASGYGFGSSLLVGGLAMLPSGLAMLSCPRSPPGSSRAVVRPDPRARGHRGRPRLAAAHRVERVAVRGHRRHHGRGHGYRHRVRRDPVHDQRAHARPRRSRAANGLNSLFRSLGSSLASAIGGSILAAGHGDPRQLRGAVADGVPGAVRDLRRGLAPGGDDRADGAAPLRRRCGPGLTAGPGQPDVRPGST